MAVITTVDCHVESDDIQCASLVPYYTVLYPRRQHSTAASHYHSITDRDDSRQLFPTCGSQTPEGCRAITSSLQSYSNSPNNSNNFAESLVALTKA